MDINPKYTGYIVGQRKKWQLLLDMTNAVEFSFDKYRFACPGESLNADDALKDIERMEKEWDLERQGRQGGSAQTVPALTKMPLNAQLYLHSVAQTLRKQYPISN